MNEGMSLYFFFTESGREQSERLKLQSSRPGDPLRGSELGVSNSAMPDKPEASLQASSPSSVTRVSPELVSVLTRYSGLRVTEWNRAVLELLISINN